MDSDSQSTTVPDINSYWYRHFAHGATCPQSHYIWVKPKPSSLKETQTPNLDQRKIVPTISQSQCSVNKCVTLKNIADLCYWNLQAKNKLATKLSVQSSNLSISTGNKIGTAIDKDVSSTWTPCWGWTTASAVLQVGQLTTLPKGTCTPHLNPMFEKLQNCGGCLLLYC
jgi:hypothetical protein